MIKAVGTNSRWMRLAAEPLIIKQIALFYRETKLLVFYRNFYVDLCIAEILIRLWNCKVWIDCLSLWWIAFKYLYFRWIVRARNFGLQNLPALCLGSGDSLSIPTLTLFGHYLLLWQTKVKHCMILYLNELGVIVILFNIKD